MKIQAQAKMLRITPRKARLVVDLIRGQEIKKAQAILTFTYKSASPMILKLLNSAIANAKFKNILLDKLYVKTIFVNEARVFKKPFFRAKGKVDTIKKRNSHITIILDHIPQKQRKVK